MIQRKNEFSQTIFISDDDLKESTGVFADVAAALRKCVDEKIPGFRRKGYYLKSVEFTIVPNGKKK